MQKKKQSTVTYKRRIFLKLLGVLITMLGLVVLGAALNAQPIHAVYVGLAIALLTLGLACIASFDFILFALDFILNIIAS